MPAPESLFIHSAFAGMALEQAQWIEAVNSHGGFGTWSADAIIAEPSQTHDVLKKHAR